MKQLVGRNYQAVMLMSMSSSNDDEREQNYGKETEQAKA